ncbi:ATP-binding cassette domain-containing protein [Youngiibacter multivorans]|uniref:ABC-type nitrate/sulfonate/bicarbonate transport system ATPase subunit n=1 Tax=Youngiibacter multivorans TaxID=937251 RepID=A0ABS4G2W5_9CLOT|nr:ATP-binding cassette domain-containing protein [Youngiibacter multivorans]MBP1918880.1 ABC-type nitrate/sulfonate/bicarbonate transport system ATPase subunit [Youngiibacter multivorans]
MKIEVRKARRQRNGRTILDAEGLVIESGTIAAVIGLNGAGKTTLLRALSGLESEEGDYILYDDEREIPHDRIAHLTQSSYLFDMTVRGNVLLGLHGKGYTEAEKEAMALDALKRVGMESFIDKKARTLSGGEAQRVTLARTLVMKKDLLVLDEPSSATDIQGAELMEDLIRDVNKRSGATVIMTTHNPSQALRLADMIVFMSGGRILEWGEPSKLLKDPQNEETMKYFRNWRIDDV